MITTVKRILSNVRGRKAALIAVTMFTFGVAFSLHIVVDAAIAADPTYGNSSRVSGTPDQTLTYNITLTKTGTFSYLVLALPANAGTSGLQIGASNLHAGKLERISGGFIYRTTTPYSITAGTRLWVMVNGITMPPAGTYAVNITAYASNGTVLAAGTTPGQQIYASKPCTGAMPNDYIQTENTLAGTTGWRLGTYDVSIASAYASQASAKCGDTLTFRINSNSIKLGATVYRMGYYGGAGARAVQATHSAIRGYGQPASLLVKTDDQGREINMTTAKNWSQSYSIRIDGSFTPGDYLIKIADENNKGTYVPFTVRDDQGSHDKLVLNSVATWQAYNIFGGYSAYKAPTGQNASRRVSYDRPITQNQGTGDFLSLEYGFVYWAEKQGYDLTYAADTDMHTMPQMVDRAKTLVLLSHTEYWSTAMRATADTAVASGKNLVSLGANQIYNRINPKASTLTGVDREYEIFRSGDTSRFRDAPNPNPEQALLGAMYGCQHMTVGTGTPNDTWLWQGVSKTPIAHLAAGETDQVLSAYSMPAGVQILTSVPIDACNVAGDPHIDIVAYVAPGGGKVFNASTHSWNCMLAGACPYGWTPTATAVTQMGQATRNIFTWIDTPATSTATVLRSTDKLPGYTPQVVGKVAPTSGMPSLDEPPDDDD
jgi:hypothetical protein